MTRILGLDLGTNSIGWCLLDSSSETKLVDMGVRVFQAGETDKKESLNLERRTKRGTRRLIQRRNRRRYRLIFFLKKEGLWPKLTNNDYITSFQNLDPYMLRKEALDRTLNALEFSRLFYHFIHKRGFLSNRKSDKKNSDEKSVVYQSIKQLREQISASGARSLGEYYFFKKQKGEKIKGSFYTHRLMYQEEFEAIISCQKASFPFLNDKEKYEEFRRIFFFQHDLKNQKYLIGKCSIEKNKKRSPKFRLAFQEFRILEQISRLHYVSLRDGELYTLSASEKDKLFSQLNKSKEMSFQKIAKLLNINHPVKFNLENDRKDKLEGNKTNYEMAKIFKDWYDKSDQEKDKICDTVFYTKTDEKLEQIARNRWQLSEEQTQKLLHIKLENSIAAYSLKALNHINNKMKDGLLLHEILSEFKNDSQDTRSEYGKLLDLPQNLRNPVVNKALFQLRKVINALILEYGQIDEIKVELARDLKFGPKRRNEMEKEQYKNQKENEEAVKSFMELNGVTEFQISRNDKLKYRLWKEANAICVYCGRSIGREQIMNSEIEIEHILPYSRTLSDSFDNKTISHKQCNAEKGNRTPYEAYAGSAQRYAEILDRVKNMNNKRKLDRFLEKDLSDSKFMEFVNRQLNDTRYISVQAVSYLRQICPNVRSGNGSVTSILRRYWKLNGLINNGTEEKNRSDHRHHAIDAIVIACTNQSTIQKLATAHANSYDNNHFKKDYENMILGIPLKDWHNYRNEIQNRLDSLIVSHCSNHKVSGALHEETYYGKTNERNEANLELFVCTKSVHVLTENEIKSIRDRRIRDIIQSHVEGKKSLGIDFKRIMSELEANPLYLPQKDGSKRPIKKVRILKPFSSMIAFKDIHGNAFRYAQSGNNHHAELIVFKNDKGIEVKDERIVSNFEAQRRKINREAIINRNVENGRLLISLFINDMILNHENQKIYRLQKMSSTKIFVYRLHTASVLDFNDEMLSKRPSNLNFSKIYVNPIGKIIKEIPC